MNFSIKRFFSKIKYSKQNLQAFGQKSIKRYLSFLKQKGPSAQKEPRLYSVTCFQKMLASDPILRMNWEHGISQCRETLPNMNGGDVLSLINAACQTPPAFSNSQIVGCPIAAIFMEFMQNENGRAFFSNKEVNESLKLIIGDYNEMLNSEKSLLHMNGESPNGWFCQEARKQIDYSLYVCDSQSPHFGFKSWNQWFLRRFKAGVRPIGTGTPHATLSDNVIVNSCESSPLVLPMQPQFGVKATDHFWLKSDVYSLSDMFAAVKYNKSDLIEGFVGGTVYQAYLSALYYHRWHAPVEGTVIDIYSVPGTYFLDQSQFIPYDQASPNNSQSFISAVATRKIIVIDAMNKHIGKIAIIYIGMAEVSSCVSTVSVGDYVQKGQQIGHFEFGGSSHAIVFQKKAKLKFSTDLYRRDSNGAIEAKRQDLSSYLAEVIVPDISTQ